MKIDSRTSLLAGAICLAIMSHVPCAAQTQQTTRRQEGDVDLLGERDRTLPATVAQPRGPALESVIAPDHYFVGPSDVFSVNIWSMPPVSYQLTVTPEGTLIIPSVGEIRVADLTLEAARAKTLEAIRKRYLSSAASMTLVAPRPLIVTVQGQVLNPGSYTMAAYNRVDKAVEEANRLLATQYEYQRETVRDKMSRRRILDRHKDGTSEVVDIPKFLATNDERWDPYLREGDIIVVPRNNFDRNVFGVYGEVNAPGRYEYVQGDSIADAIRIAYGFTPHARQDSLELSRQDSTGRIIARRTLDARAILDRSVPDVALQPGDGLLVRGGVDDRGDYRVIVTGEVKFPGTYPISRASTRLSRVIATAGGFTDNASLETAEVQRHLIDPSQIELERLESLRGGVPPDDSTYYYMETNLRLRKEVVNVDFVRLFRDRDTLQDVQLEDGDIISVPSVRRTVYVFGQVVNPGHVGYVPGQDVWYYVRKAGGVTDRAREGDTKLVKAKSRQWLSPVGQIVEEGDYVWVPKDPERPFGYYLNIVAQSAAVITVALSAIVVVIQLRK